MLDILIFVCLTVKGHIINDAIIYPGCSKERFYRECTLPYANNMFHFENHCFGFAVRVDV